MGRGETGRGVGMTGGWMTEMELNITKPPDGIGRHCRRRIGLSSK
jgi:hypothetical protein